MTMRTLYRTQCQWSRSASPREAFLARVGAKAETRINSFDKVVNQYAFIIRCKQSDVSMTLGSLFLKNLISYTVSDGKL